MGHSRDAKFYGLHACEALAAARPEAVQRAFFEERIAPRFGGLTSQLAKRRRPYRVVSDEELATIAGSQHHEGVCLVADRLEPPRLEVFLSGLSPTARVVFLDGVNNPHNVGVILRTAAHFGCAGLVAWSEDVAAPAGAAARVAEGAAESVPLLRVDDPRAALRALQRAGFERVATVVREGESVFEAELPRRCLFLVGAEGEGLGRSALAIADRRVTIPGTGDVDSLNVASACAVLLAEHVRRHGL